MARNDSKTSQIRIQEKYAAAIKRGVPTRLALNDATESVFGG